MLASSRKVTGADPASAMLDIARSRPGGERVEWVEADARSLSLETRFDLILLDIKMPGVSGIDILSALEPNRHGCIVIATGLQDEELRRECLAAGADEVMLKPLDIPHLLKLTEEVRKTGDCREECQSPVTP